MIEVNGIVLYMATPPDPAIPVRPHRDWLAGTSVVGLEGEDQPDSLAFLQVSINQPGAASSGASPAQIFQDIREAMSDGRTDLDGLGDAAFIATGGIYVLQGERMISIGAGNTSRPEVQARLRSAAGIALGRLQQP